jgi:ATP-dependent Lon protease
MRAIKKELGDRDEFKTELRDLEEKIKKKKMSEEAVEKVKAELKKLRMMSPLSAEAAVIRNYIETMIGLPWYDVTDLEIDIDEARGILMRPLIAWKQRSRTVLVLPAVQNLVKELKGPILCLVCPPGVGKTSAGKSWARAAGRRIRPHEPGRSAGRAEIRGHRRT